MSSDNAVVREASAIRIQASVRGKHKHNLLRGAAIAAAAARSWLELKTILTKAFHAVGEENASEAAIAARDALASLYIRTPEQLKTALDDHDVLREVQSVLRGMLLPEVRRQLKAADVGAAWRQRATELIKPTWVPPPRVVRTLEIVRCDVSHISEIDQLSQTFRARVFLVLRIADGALDNDLMRQERDFPLDSWGRPTFRCSAPRSHLLRDASRTRLVHPRLDAPRPDATCAVSRASRVCVCPRPYPRPCRRPGRRRSGTSTSSRSRTPRS